MFSLRHGLEKLENDGHVQLELRILNLIAMSFSLKFAFPVEYCDKIAFFLKTINKISNIQVEYLTKICHKNDIVLYVNISLVSFQFFFRVDVLDV